MDETCTVHEAHWPHDASSCILDERFGDGPIECRRPATGCHCATCGSIHADFIATFGRWPTMSHDDALALQASRDRAEASWDRMTAGMRR